jgi:CxxC-x17-CxxC domain-containing protein
MAFGTDRQMYDVDLTCAKCGNHISQLPFQPTSGRPVYCSDCNRSFRQQRGGSNGGGFRSNGPRQMYNVNLTCASCGTAVTQLPFQPTGDKPVYCRSCLQARKNG